MIIITSFEVLAVGPAFSATNALFTIVRVLLYKEDFPLIGFSFLGQFYPFNLLSVFVVVVVVVVEPRGMTVS